MIFSGCIIKCACFPNLLHRLGNSFPLEVSKIWKWDVSLTTISSLLRHGVHVCSALLAVLSLTEEIWEGHSLEEGDPCPSFLPHQVTIPPTLLALHWLHSSRTGYTLATLALFIPPTLPTPFLLRVLPLLAILLLNSCLSLLFPPQHIHTHTLSVVN